MVINIIDGDNNGFNIDEDSELVQYVQYDNFDLVFGDFEDHSLRHVEVEQTELEHHQETHTLINTHFPQLMEKLNDREDWTSHDYVGVSALVIAAFVVLIAVRVLLRWLTRHHAASISTHSFGSQANSMVSLKDSLNKIKTDLVNTKSEHQRLDWAELNSLAHSLLFHVSSDFTRFEAIMGDCDTFHPSHDAMEALSDRVAMIVKSLEALHRSDSSSHMGNKALTANNKSSFRVMHIEDRLMKHTDRKKAAEVRLSFDLLRDALREGRVQSKRRQLQLTLNRLWKAINAKDEYGALECLEILGEEQRHRPEYSAALSMLTALCDAEVQQVKEEEQWTFEVNKAEMIEAFQTFSLSGTPRETKEDGRSGTGSSKKQLLSIPTGSASGKGNVPRVQSDPVFSVLDIGVGDTDCTATPFTEAVEATSAPPVPEVAGAADSRDKSAGLGYERFPCDEKHPNSSSDCSSPQRNLIHSNSSHSCLSAGPSSPIVPSGTGMLINSQWAMEALKMKRESQLSVERRLQELRARRAERREAARRGARWILDERDREARKAWLFLDGLEEQKKLRMAEENEVFRRIEQELLKELKSAHEQQRLLDERIFRTISVVAVIVYLISHSRFDIAGGGVYSLYKWMLRTLRSSCEFLSCDASSAVTAAARSMASTTTSISSAAVSTTHTHVKYVQFALPETPAADALNRSAVLALRSYQSNYRSLSQYLATAMLEPLLSRATAQYTVGAALLPFVSSRKSQQEPAGGTGGWAELVATGKCAAHLLARSLPAVTLSKLFRFIGLKEMSGWAAFLFSVLCFSDVLLQMALGPMLPLLVAGVVHRVLYELVMAGSLRWQLRGWDVRWLALYVVYPVLVVVLLGLIGQY